MSKKIARRDVRVYPNADGTADTDAIRCHHVNVAEARSFPGANNPKFEVTLMFDKKNKTHIEALKLLKADLIACLHEQWPDPATRPLQVIVADQPGSGDGSPIKDGDIAINKKRVPIKEANPEYAGHYIVKASCKEANPPALFGSSKAVILPSQCRSGFWYKVALNAYAFLPGTGGVTVGLEALQLIREDTPLSGNKTDAEGLFSDVGGDNLNAYDGGLDDISGDAEKWLNKDTPQGQNGGGGSLI